MFMTSGIRNLFARAIEPAPRQNDGSVSSGHLLERYAAWLSKLAYLIKRDFGQRHRRSSVGALVSLAEPIFIVLIMSLIRWTTSGIIDWNEAVYHTTGVIPYFYFLHLSLRIRIGDTDRPIPGVILFDRLLAIAIAETLSKAIAILVTMIFFYKMGAWRAVPNSPIGCLLPVGCLMMCGMGVGLFNAAVGRVAPTYLYIYGFFMRLLLFTSGIILRPDIIPPRVRWLIEYNPIFHGVNWFRVEWFPNFPIILLDKNYVFQFGAVSIVVGLVAYNYIGKKD